MIGAGSRCGWRTCSGAVCSSILSLWRRRSATCIEWFVPTRTVTPRSRRCRLALAYPTAFVYNAPYTEGTVLTRIARHLLPLRTTSIRLGRALGDGHRFLSTERIHPRRAPRRDCPGALGSVPRARAVAGPAEYTSRLTHTPVARSGRRGRAGRRPDALLRLPVPGRGVMRSSGRACRAPGAAPTRALDPPCSQ